MMRILTTRRFERDFRRLPKNVRRRVDEAIRSLAENPYMGRALRGRLMGFRSLRIGDYRVIYRVDEKRRAVILFCVGHRRAIYRS